MSFNPESQKPNALARAVHTCLLAGSVAAAILFVIGLVLVLSNGPARPDVPPTISESLFQNALHGDGFAILDLGVLVLMITPLLRIVVLAVGWSMQKDFRFALVALVVFLLLMTSMLIGVG